MPSSICLDTNILFQFPIDDQKIRTIRAEYETIKKDNGPLTNWQYILFTENDLVLSPLAVWEYLSVKTRTALKGTIKSVNGFSGTLQATSTIKKRFGVESTIDPCTLALAHLFAGATGVPCDDSYHFVHAARNSIKFFATANEKHFRPVSTLAKSQITRKMIKILDDHEPINAVCVFRMRFHFLQSLSPTSLRKEILNLSKRDWPKIITQPVEIP